MFLSAFTTIDYVSILLFSFPFLSHFHPPIFGSLISYSFNLCVIIRIYASSAQFLTTIMSLKNIQIVNSTIFLPSLVVITIEVVRFVIIELRIFQVPGLISQSNTRVCADGCSIDIAGQVMGFYSLTKGFVIASLDTFFCSTGPIPGMSYLMKIQLCAATIFEKFPTHFVTFDIVPYF